MPSKLRWGIAGAGGIAKTFAKNLDKSEFGIKQAIGSRTLEKAQAFAADLGFAMAHGSYEDLFADPEVDAVYVATPHPCHKDVVLGAIAAGKHVLCEKPMGVTPEECEEMVAAADLAQVVLLEAFMYRLHPQTQMIQKLIAAGRIGKVCTIRSCFCYGLGNAYNVRSDLSLRGGGLYDVGCYCINFSRMVAGEEPDSATALWTVGDESGVDENLAAVLHFPSGALAVFDVGIRSAGDKGAEILGTEGMIRVPNPWNPNAQSTSIELLAKGRAPETIEITDGGHCFALEADHLAQVVAGECEALIPATNAIGNAEVLDLLWQQITDEDDEDDE